MLGAIFLFDFQPTLQGQPFFIIVLSTIFPSSVTTRSRIVFSRLTRFPRVSTIEIVAASMVASFRHSPGHGTARYTLRREWRDVMSFALMLSASLVTGGYPVYAQRVPEFPVESHRGPAFPKSVSPTEPFDVRSSTSQPRSPQSPPLNDLCGSSNEAVSSAPTTSCTADTTSAVSGSGPWRWSCIGSDGTTRAQCSATVKTALLAQKPGPSADLFANPYYTCFHNYYVSASGIDSNDGSSNSPWRNLQRADIVARASGDCINVAPGAYEGLTIRGGGNAATSSGYVVYRCTVMNACTITDPGNHGSAPLHSALAVQANYIIIDGFTIAASSAMTFGEGVGAAANIGNSYVFSYHHIWVLNSIISGYGLSGIQLNEGEFFYSVHNTIYNNAIGANCNSGAQGSGISYASLIPVSGYPLTSDDQSNPVTGNTGTLFRNFVMWNVVYNNHVVGCRPSTDGNGIIFDTGSWGCYKGGSGSPDCTSGASPYVNGSLVAFNVTYNNGGGGIHILSSPYVTVANNSCYNNYTDTGISSGGNLPCIDDNGSWGSTFINNVSYVPCNASPTYQIAIGPFGAGGASVPFRTTLANVGGINSSVTSIPLASASTMLTGASGLAGNGSYALAGGNMIYIDSELMLVTAGWGTTTLTVQRGFQGTTAASHSNGATITWVPDYFSHNITYAATGSGGCSDGSSQTFSGDVYPSTDNTINTNVEYTNVGNSSTGSDSAQPNGTNFALHSGSVAIGYGMTPSWLPSQAKDAGACSSTLAVCP